MEKRNIVKNKIYFFLWIEYVNLLEINWIYGELLKFFIIWMIKYLKVVLILEYIVWIILCSLVYIIYKR